LFDRCEQIGYARIVHIGDFIMRRTFIAALLFLASVCVVVVWALPGEPKPTALECHLRDGSVLQLEPSEAKFVIVTKYGTLTVPLSDIVKLEPALPRSAEVERDIQQWMTDLGSPQFAAREKAQAQLIDHADVAYPQLKAGLKAESAEVAKRCETILRMVQRTVNDDTYRDQSVDIITTKDVTVLRGKLETTSIKARTKSLGELTIQLADVKSLGKVPDREVTRQMTPVTGYSTKGKGGELPLPDFK
jgi:hypothetical protein